MAIRALLRGPGLFGKPGWVAYTGLKANQPMILVREPDNVNDSNAIEVRTLLNESTGYVSRGAAAKIAPLIDKGEVWLCKVLNPYAMPRPVCILLWRDPPREARRGVIKARRRQVGSVLLHASEGKAPSVDVDIDGYFDTPPGKSW